MDFFEFINKIRGTKYVLKGDIKTYILYNDIEAVLISELDNFIDLIYFEYEGDIKNLKSTNNHHFLIGNKETKNHILQHISKKEIINSKNTYLQQISIELDRYRESA
jgi:endonuclease V-like protein UPF0215 family